MKKREDIMALNEKNRRLIDEMSEDPKVRQMALYMQHGHVTTFGHCRRVAEKSCRISELLHLPVSERELVRGAFLHDYFLYDWHSYESPRGERLHGFSHPAKALENAREDFHLTEKEENIIESHMWPLLPTKMPRCKEALLVCIMDKICSLEETIRRR